MNKFPNEAELSGDLTIDQAYSMLQEIIKDIFVNNYIHLSLTSDSIYRTIEFDSSTLYKSGAKWVIQYPNWIRQKQGFGIKMFANPFDAFGEFISICAKKQVDEWKMQNFFCVA